MSDESKARFEDSMVQYLRARVSRTRFLATAGAAGAIALLPKGTSAQTTESVQTIINIADTAEHLAVTVLTAAVGNAQQLGLTGILLAFTQAALAEEQYHADFLEKNGAVPLTDTFTVPDPKILTDQKTFFHTIETAETIFIGAYMAAVREFTALGQPTLAKIAYQIGGVEAEHRAHVRAGMALTGDATGVPPNNKAFESNVVATVGDAAKMLQAAGFIGGSGTQAKYPGRAAALAAAGSVGAGLLNQTPNSTSAPLSARVVNPRKAALEEYLSQR